MKLTDIIDRVAEDLNLTSETAKARIGRHVNMKYRELVTEPWLQIVRRGTITQLTTPNSQFVTFPVTKLYNVFDMLHYPNNALSELAMEEVRNLTPLSNPPDAYAIYGQTASTVTILTNGLPTTPVLLTVDAEIRLVDLMLENVPKFNEDFHDALYYGAKNLELMKMEKDTLAEEADAKYLKRVSALKYHIAKTSYLNFLQGKNSSQGPPAFVNTLVSS